MKTFQHALVVCTVVFTLPWFIMGLVHEVTFTDITIGTFLAMIYAGQWLLLRKSRMPFYTVPHTCTDCRDTGYEKRTDSRCRCDVGDAISQMRMMYPLHGCSYPLAFDLLWGANHLKPLAYTPTVLDGPLHARWSGIEWAFDAINGVLFTNSDHGCQHICGRHRNAFVTVRLDAAGDHRVSVVWYENDRVTSAKRVVKSATVDDVIATIAICMREVADDVPRLPARWLDDGSYRQEPLQPPSCMDFDGDALVGAATGQRIGRRNK